jgi:hypothetical protein
MLGWAIANYAFFFLAVALWGVGQAQSPASFTSRPKPQVVS